MSIRKDVVKLNIQQNAYFLVYHKNIDIGFGLTVALYIYEKEFLKFDCFGSNDGHYHILNTEERLYFKEQTVYEQIAKAIYELNNISPYLACCRNIQIKNFQFDIAILKSKLLIVEQLLFTYENKYYASLRV